MLTTLSPPPLKRRRLSGLEPQSFKQFTPEDLTIYSWNINGVDPFLERRITSFFPTQRSVHAKDETKASVRDFLRRHDWPTMLFLQEVKIHSNDGETVRALERVIRSDSDGEPDYVSHVCLPSGKYTARASRGKVYGVCTMIRTDFHKRYVERVREVEWDTVGRFLVVETKAGSNMPKLALVNVYAVNGTDHAYKDPATGKVAGTRHHRKLRVHQLLAAETRALQANGFKVVLAGDMNVARSDIDGHPKLRRWPKQHCDNRVDFEAKFLHVETVAEQDQSSPLGPSRERSGERGGLGMVDTFRHLHPESRAYTYYPRNKAFGESCDRVDMVLISASLEENLTDAGMHETPAERGPSDHVPIFARLAFSSETIVE